jgi:hypothetical protein
MRFNVNGFFGKVKALVGFLSPLIASLAVAVIP